MTSKVISGTWKNLVKFGQIGYILAYGRQIKGAWPDHFFDHSIYLNFFEILVP